MGVRIRAAVFTISMLAVACTGNPQEPAPSTIPPDTGSPTSNASPAIASSEPGWLAVNLRFEPGAIYFTEGSVSFVKVFEPEGDLVGRVHSKDSSVFFRQQLAPGDYEVKTYRRPCDGSCGALDPPRDRCEFRVEMRTDGANRLVAVRVKLGDYAANGECVVSDRGDVVDLDASPMVTDYVSFTRALGDAGYEVRHGERTSGPFFSAPGQFVYAADAQLQVFEYPTRAALDDERFSISPDGDGVPTKDGGSAIVEWVRPPHFFGSGKLLVLYFGDGPVVLETLNLLLGPQFAGR